MISFTAHVRSDGDYGVRVRVNNLPANLNGIVESMSTLWAVPYDPVHNPQRFKALPSGMERKVFLTNPTYCDSGPLPRTISATPWAFPSILRGAIVYGDQAPDGCEKLMFGGLQAPASLAAQPDNRSASSPAGLLARLSLPFNPDPYSLARPALRSTEVVLPEGVTVNPSAATGMQACTEAEIGLKSLDPPRCPNGSKLADVEVVTPLLADPLQGEMYLAEQDKNPFDSTMAMYLRVAGQGIQVKVAGRVDRDPETGQVTTSFIDNPQTPFTDMTLRFKSGPRAPVVLPAVCGTYETTTTLTPWSHPHSGPPVVSKDPFTVSEGPDGVPCVNSLAERGFSPTMRAGSESAGAGKFSPFNVRFTRTDAEQEFDRITVRTPKGLAGKIKGVPYCSEAGIANAIGRDESGDGKVEMDDPSCSEASRVGKTVVGVGAGPSPYYAEGKVYLAGPYDGAPLSMVFIVPAVAGPFDLGVQVVRTALNVDRFTAQISAASDEIPKILEGIPLRIRDIRVLMDRPEFTLNPTNCTEQRVEATIRGAQGASSEVSNRFQVGDCAALDFNPRFQMKILDKGRKSTLRSWNPRTKFTVRPRPGNSNMGPSVVTLPSTVILDQGNIKTLCTRAQFAEDKCPERAIYGYAKAWSPLLDEPVEGPVYMQANGGVRPIPDILADLRGQVKVALEGWVSTVRRGGKGRLRNTFNVVPDVPVTRFELTMRGGKTTGLLVNSTDLCRNQERGVARFTSANGKVSLQRPQIQMTFKGCNKVRRQAARRAAKRKAAKRAAARRVVWRAKARAADSSEAGKEARSRR